MSPVFAIHRRFSRKVVVIITLGLLSACGANARVVSDSQGPGIQQAQQEPYAGPKRSLAVKAFSFKAGRGGHRVGQGMSDMLTDALFNSGRFIVLERENIKDVLDEQDLGASGRVKPSTAAPKGQLEGAELLVRGSVIQFEPRCSGGSAIVFSASRACIAINIRIIDSATGRVVNATTVEGSSVDKRIGFVTRSELPIGLGMYKGTPMERAIRNTIQAAVDHIINTKL
ncbi:MAG: CsgG/HfaB family protein [Gammaproteobacteria bacterium]|nr:CsgG/HfaB family protein [Gammaproteobacteria bacterium]